MSRVEREEGPQFGPLRPGRRGVPRREPAGGDRSESSAELDPGSLVGWLITGIASIAAVALLLEIWAGSPEDASQAPNSLIVVVAWAAILVFVIARDHGRALRVFNVLAFLCALIFVAVVVLAIVQFLRLAGES